MFGLHDKYWGIDFLCEKGSMIGEKIDSLLDFEGEIL
jgi:hypothetical protein